MRRGARRQASFAGFRLLTAPPPASGAVLIAALKILEGYALGAPSLRREDGGGAEAPGASRTGLSYHRIVEAFKVHRAG